VDSEDRGVSPGLGCCDVKLGNQNIGRSRHQGDELTCCAVLKVESPGFANGFAALVVRGTGTTVVVNVDQPGCENVPCAVEDVRVILNELTPGEASAGGKDVTIFEGDKGVRTVETCAEQPDGVDDGGGGAHGPGQYAAGQASLPPMVV
jgi:hypothetical protein